MKVRSTKAGTPAPSGVVLLAVVLSCSRGERRAAPATASSPDVVLVTIDTLRADATGFGGNTRVKTPNLDRLAAAGVTFTDAHAHNVVTLPSHTNILTGLLPYVHGVRDNAGFRLGDGVETLATRLRARGYATGAFVAAFPLDRRFGLARGFDVYDDRYGKGADDLSFRMPERPGTEVVSRALDWYRAGPKGHRFLWVHVFEPHAPYAPPPPFDAEYRDAPYLGEVAAADRALEPLVSALLGGDPVVAILTSDHGESLGEHGELTHGLFAYEGTLRVPLVVVAPGVAPRRDTRPAAHVDVVPTVLAALGLLADPSLPGTSLLGTADRAPRFQYFEALSARLNRGWAPLTGVLRGTRKYVDLPIRELYDLRVDPHEEKNLASSLDAEVREMKRAVPADAGNPGARGTASAEEVARLRALGYVTSSAPSGKGTFTEADDPKRLVEVDRRIQQLVDLYQRGDLAAAIRTGEEVVKAHPGIGTAVEQLAFLYQQADRPSDAIRLLERSLAAGVDSRDLRVRLARVLSEAGRAADAVRLLRPHEKEGDPAVLLALGIALADSGDLAGAEETLSRARTAEPDDPTTLQSLGVVAIRAGRFADARERFRSALAINPALPAALNGLGAAEARLGNVDAALDAWARALRANPRDLDALYNLSTTAARSGRAAEAAPLLRQFVATAPPGRYAREIAEAQALLAKELPGER